MKIFRAYIHRSLLKNPVRTAVTVIGILLSASMFTAVLVSVSSFLDYTRRLAIEQNGSYHILYASNGDGGEILENRNDVQQSATLTHIGFSKIGSRNSAKPYLALESMSENFTDLVSLRLLSGRMPKGPEEILLPGNLRTNGGVKTALNDRLTLKIGTRKTDDLPLGLQSAYLSYETFTESGESRDCTVVGYYERFNYDIDPYTSAGYMALTTGEQGGKENDTITFVQAKSIYRTGPLQDAIIDASSTVRMNKNTDLYNGHGLLSQGGADLIVGFVLFLMLLILFGSVALIYNSFSITLSERTKQMGILNSVGATKKQLRASVRYEAFLLCLVGVPLGILGGIAGMGVTFFLLRDITSAILGNGLYIKLAVSPLAIVFAFIVTVLTVFISASIPARRALRVNAVEAIRQTGDIKMPKRTGRGWIWEKLFHLEGQLAYKNSRRFRRRYRATVFSLVVSIFLFVAAYTFSSYLTVTAEQASGLTTYDLLCHVTDSTDENELSIMETYRDLSALPGIKSSALVASEGYMHLQKQGAPIREDAIDHDSSLASEDELFCAVMTVDMDNYLKLLDLAGIARPAAGEKYPLLLIDRNTNVIQKEDGRKYYDEYSVFDSSAFPCSLHVKTNKVVKDGTLYDSESLDYLYFKTALNEKGEEVTVEYLRFFPEGKNPEECGEEDFLYLTEEEYLAMRQTVSVDVAAVLQQSPWYWPGSEFVFVKPYAAEADFDAPIPVQQHPQFYFQSDDPTALEEKIAIYSETESSLPLSLYNVAKSEESERAMLTVINVFAYGFIALISLISVANVFNTISTGIILRRREFAMLRSIGMTDRGFTKMLCCESLLFGVRGLFIGIPSSMLLCFLLQQHLHRSFREGFPLPWNAAFIAIVCVLVVVFISMFYALRKIKRDNPIDTLKNENI